ncbi:Kelch repeat-containing protein [Leptospira barantonii]|nr:kelch repeat-containing protein [Leptospira barantonii]
MRIIRIWAVLLGGLLAFQACDDSSKKKGEEILLSLIQNSSQQANLFPPGPTVRRSTDAQPPSPGPSADFIRSERKQDFLAKIDRPVAFSVNGKGYLAFRDTPTTAWIDLWEYSPNTDSWTQKQTLVTGQSNVGLVAFGVAGKGYLSVPVNSTFNFVNKYDPTTNVWTQIANMPGGPRSNGAAFVIGTKAYVGTGRSLQGTVLKSFYELDTVTETWRSVADLPAARMDSVAFVLNGAGYVGGGQDALHQLSDFWQYQPQTNGPGTWIQIASFPGITGSGTGTSVDGKGLIIGYVYAPNPNFERQVWSYDPSVGWKQETNLYFSSQPESLGTTASFTTGSFAYSVIGQKVYQFQRVIIGPDEPSDM